MKKLFIIISILLLSGFVVAKQNSDPIKDRVIEVVQFCDAMNPVFTYRCVQYQIEEIKYSLNSEAHHYEIEWLNDLLFCYPEENRWGRNSNGKRRRNGFIDDLRTNTIHGDRRYARKVVGCVVDKLKN